MNVIVRSATIKDLSTLREFEQGVINAERPFDPTIKAGNISYYDLEALIRDDDAEVIVAEHEGKVVGSGYAKIREALPWLNHTHYAYLGFMYTSPEYRGKGINQKIIEALKQWARVKNIHEIRLEVYYENEIARKAYEKIGFESHMLEMRLGL